MSASSTWETAPGAEIDIPREIETPSLVIDLPRVRQNLEDMANFAKLKGVALAPHVKTHRTIEFAQLQTDYGAERLCVAKLSEAEHFVDAGFQRLVMAYPIAGDVKFQRAIRLLARADLTLGVDSQEAAIEFSKALSAAGAQADVLVLVDTGFHRTGVSPGEAVDLARLLSHLDGIQFKGLLTHEGHASVVGAQDDIRIKAETAGDTMAQLAETIRSSGIPVETVSVGSTATAKYATRPGVTEIRPGIYPFNDLGQVSIGTVGIERCAARVVTTVVSHASPDRAVVDAGSKTLSQDQLSIWGGNDESVYGLVIGQPGWKLHRLSEEHGWLRWEGDGSPSPLEIGGRLQVLPVHICSVFHGVGEAEIVEDGRSVGRWMVTARGLSK